MIHCEATDATTNNAIELCNCSFHIQLNLIKESILFCVSIEQRNPFMLPYISWPEFGLFVQELNQLYCCKQLEVQ